jgi:hypothetical protein
MDLLVKDLTNIIAEYAGFYKLRKWVDKEKIN